MINSDEVKKIIDALEKIQAKLSTLASEQNTTVRLRLSANKAITELIKTQSQIYRCQDELTALEELENREQKTTTNSELKP
jgi:CYTH domain-containing protein